jgi:DNA-binding CsgD family transcriptional regulator
MGSHPRFTGLPLVAHAGTARPAAAEATPPASIPQPMSGGRLAAPHPGTRRVWLPPYRYCGADFLGSGDRTRVALVAIAWIIRVNTGSEGVDVMSGPFQLLAVSLLSGDPVARILAGVDRLEARSGVRVLDMMIVEKGQDGSVVRSSIGRDDDLGELVARLFPIGGAGAEHGDGAPAQLWGLAQALPAGTAVAFLLVEHRWARELFDVIDEEGGALLGSGFLAPELGLVVDAELAAMEQAARSIAAAQAAEAEARLRAVAALAEADEAVAASARIRSAAAAETLRVLTQAGLLELAAASEAADALSNAGLIMAAAGEAADRAVEEAVARGAAADEAADEAVARDREAVRASDEQAADARMAASVTPAEIRVLRYLPTKLSFALIADKLGISRGAARSRAERAYKKLGVHSRADAVDRARTLRIVP